MSKTIKCEICKEIKKCNKNRKYDIYVCRNCYKSNFQPKEICIICGELERAEKRDENSNAICDGCYSRSYIRKIEVCIKCGKEKPVQARDENGNALCHEHYVPPKDECCKCHKVGPIVIRNEDGMGICEGCYERPKDFCFVCGKYRPVHSRDKNGNALCNAHSRLLEICFICNKEKEVASRSENNSPICSECTKKIRYHNDENFRIKENLRNRLGAALRIYSKIGKIRQAKEYGIDYQKIFKYLGECPGNRVEYHIDHIFPLSAFDFNDPIQIKAAFAPENHQWLKVEENLTKQNKYNEEDFKIYLNKFYVGD